MPMDTHQQGLDTKSLIHKGLPDETNADEPP